MTDRRSALLARRVPREEVVPGRAYVIHARNGGIGVAVHERGLLGYRLHRVKFTSRYLFVEFDWADHDQFGTAIPLRELPDAPPAGDDALLAWLSERELEHAGEIRAAWEEVLGSVARKPAPSRSPGAR
jgi:hypothetical protein